MNAFDFIVTIAPGPALATEVLNKNVTLADGALSYFLLIGLQNLMSFFAVRSKTFASLIKATPTMLLFRGKVVKEVMRKERITEEEILGVIWQKELSSLSETGVFIPETDGTLTVVNHAHLQNDVPEPLKNMPRLD